jgi:hypothetical protein
MITCAFCDQDSFFSIDTQVITDHLTINPLHTMRYVAMGDTATPQHYGGSTMAQVNVDPSTPSAGQTWVLATPIAASGSPIGLLLALTQSTTQYAYQFSYYTNENTIQRMVLS